MNLKYRQLHSSFVAQIEGVDLKTDRGPAVAEAIEAILDQHSVVVLRGQFLNDDEQIELSKQLGELSYAMKHGRQKNQNARLETGTLRHFQSR